MKTVFVTGATSGIGKAMAIALAKAGYKVYAAGRNRAALDELANSSDAIEAVCVDVTDLAAAQAAVKDLEIDIFVSNAGIMPPVGKFAEIDPAEIDRTIGLNITANLHMTRLVLPKMVERGSGHLVFTGSTAGHMVFPNLALYSASKAVVSAFANSLRAELSPFGIRVTEIVPGRTETSLYHNVLDQEAVEKMYADRSAVQPEDIATMLVTALSLPEWANCARFDVVPTRPAAPAGAK